MPASQKCMPMVPLSYLPLEVNAEGVVGGNYMSELTWPSSGVGLKPAAAAARPTDSEEAFDPGLAFDFGFDFAFGFVFVFVFAFAFAFGFGFCALYVGRWLPMHLTMPSIVS